MLELEPTQKKSRRTSRSGESFNFLFNLSTFVFCGLFGLLLQGGSLGYIYLLYAFHMTVYGVFYYKWLSRTPYALIEDNELVIFNKPHFKLTIILLNSIKKVNIEIWTGIFSKIRLLLTNNSHTDNILSSLTTEDGEQFIQALVEPMEKK